MFIVADAHRCFCIFSIMPLFFFSACIGGGGGGGGGGTNFGSAGSEYAAQSGLGHVAASAALNAGYSGRNIRIGIADSGIDGQHSEFSGRLNAGHDWQSSSDGRIDLHGHGTHVAAIASAAQDGNGMHGVAPNSQLYAYRILNASGKFGSQTGESMIPSLVSDARRKNVHIINNSWGSRTEINDITKSEIETELPRELAAWQSAVNSGMVMVWAAGNQRDNEVSVRAGLPHYFSSLRPGWLTVVSSGASGTEPVYTNRCGISANWCLAAPGGGDAQNTTGIWAANTGGGYVRRSGTSMSAPHVSGGLALLLEAFPSLSPQAAAARLLQTASYDGLVTADGCTLSRCGTTRMQSVFGRGQMDLQSALAPVLGLTLATSTDIFDAQDSQLSAGSVLYGPLKTALSRRPIIGADKFDGAHFTLNGGNFVTPEAAASADMMATTMPPRKAPMRAISRLFGWQHYLVRDNNGALVHQHPERLFDLSSAPQKAVYIIDNSGGQGRTSSFGWTLRYSYDEPRSSASVLWRQEVKDTKIWFGQGVDDQKGSWLNSAGEGAFALAGAQSVWQFAGLHQKAGYFRFQLEGLQGKSWLKSSSGLLRGGQVSMQSWLVQLHADISSSHSLSVSYGQPLHARKGRFEIYDTATKASRQIEFAHQSKEYQQRIAWQYNASSGLDISVYYLDISHPSSELAKAEQRLGAALRLKF